MPRPAKADDVKHDGPREPRAGEPPKLDLQSLRQPQDSDHGVAAVFGRWPGDESSEEIFKALEDLS